MKQNEDGTAELHFAANVRAAITTEIDRLEWFMAVRFFGMALVMGGVGYWRYRTGTGQLDELLVAATAAVVGVLASAVAMNVPVLLGARFALRSHTRGGPAAPSQRLTRMAAVLTVLPLAVPFWAATQNVYTTAALMFMAMPLGVFISNSMLSASVNSWSREIAQLALAQRWEDRKSGEGPAPRFAG